MQTWILLKRFLKLYAIFAALNLTYKVGWIIYLIPRCRYLWRKLPGKPLDILNRNLRKSAGNLHLYIADQSQSFPGADIIRIDASFPGLIFNSERSLQWLLKEKFDDVSKPGEEIYLFELMSEFLGPNGIFVLRHGKAHHPVDHEMWLKERKIASLIFTKANFQSFMYDTFASKGKCLISRLENIPKDEFFDIQEIFFSFTMDSIEKLFLGTDVNTVEGGMSEYAKSFDEAHQLMMKYFTDHVLLFMLNRVILPYPIGTLGVQGSEGDTWSGYMDRYFSKDYQGFKAAIKRLDTHIYSYIKQTRNDPNIDSRKDIIANFLNSPMGAEMTDEVLRDIVLSLTIAGRDTTACALSWMVYELTQHPTVQEKLCNEIDLVLKGSLPSMEDTQEDKMPYLNGVIYETLRLHPSVPTNMKCNESELVYYDGTVIPVGTRLIFSTYGINRNPIKYPNPTKFEPDRWIPFKQPNLFEFPVFQAGPRFCLGKDMAQFEMKLLACMIFQKFKFNLKPDEVGNIKMSLMLTTSVTNTKPGGTPTHQLLVSHKNRV